MFKSAPAQGIADMSDLTLTSDYNNSVICVRKCSGSGSFFARASAAGCSYFAPPLELRRAPLLPWRHFAIRLESSRPLLE